MMAAQNTNPKTKPVPQSNKAQQVGLIKEISAPRLKSRLLIKVIALNIVNIITVAVVVFILMKLPGISQEIMELRKDEVLASFAVDEAVLTQELERTKPQIDKLNEAISDEDGVLSFINLMDALRVEGVISEFTFLRNEPIVDSTKQKGLPIQIVAEGSRDTIKAALERINGLPRLIRPITVNLEFIENEDNRLKLTYGGLLYVKKDFNQN